MKYTKEFYNKFIALDNDSKNSDVNTFKNECVGKPCIIISREYDENNCPSVFQRTIRNIDAYCRKVTGNLSWGKIQDQTLGNFNTDWLIAALPLKKYISDKMVRSIQKDLEDTFYANERK